MKKHSFYFIGECAVILALLLVIGILIKDNKHMVQKEENITEVVEVNNEKTEVIEEAESIEETEIIEEAKAIEETEVIEEAESIEEPTHIGDKLLENNTFSKQEDKVKIVVFGDSIWNANRGENGISEQVMEAIDDVVIYNCAIGGTTAAVDGETTNCMEWTSRSFNGMMYIATDIVDAGQLIPDDEAYKVIESVDFNEVDYVIISYGLNDYFSDIPIHPQEYYDMTSYVGALRHGIQKLHEKYPDMEFILTSPTYCEWFKGERQFELGAYTEAARGVAQEMGTHFLDMYHALGKTPSEKTEYLSDGVHLTDEGMSLYANSVIEFLKGMEGING